MIVRGTLWGALRLGLASVTLHKLRSILTTLGIVLGVASVIIMLAIGEAARARAIAQIEEMGATNIILRSVKPRLNASINANNVRISYGLTMEDLDRMQSTVPAVVSATPIRESRRQLGCGQRTTAAKVVAVVPGYFALSGLTVRRGRRIGAIDNERFENVVVLAADTAEDLFPVKDPLGRSVRIDNDIFRIVGVVSPMANLADDPQAPTEGTGKAYIPYQTDRSRFGRFVTDPRAGSAEELEINQITVSVAQTDHVKNTAKIIETMIGQFHKGNDVEMIVPLQLLEKAKRAQRVYTLVLGAISSIALVVGGIGIMNIMLATVTERTREIGIRRALGAKRRDIIVQFLIEAVLLSSSGGVVGTCLGVSLSHLLTHISGLQTIVLPWAVCLAFTISAVVGLVFGTWPARRAALMDPIEALRHE